MHHLKLLVRDSQLDARHLVISDISEYDATLPISNHALFIHLPGFAEAVQVLFTVKGTVSYSSRTLGLSTGKTLYDLPDGAYVITYSVSPNSKVNTVSYHYRTAYLEKLLYAKAADVKCNHDEHTIDACGNIELTKYEAVLSKAFLLLEGLKGNLNGDKDKVRADDQYQEILKLLSDLKSGY